MPRRAKLLCSAHPLGYGPAAKLVAIAAELQHADMELVFVGQGTPLELVLRHRGLFHDVEAVSPAALSAASLKSCDGVLSIMDRDLASLADECSRPLYVVDSLLWMRDEIPPMWRGAMRYWAQDFVGLRTIASTFSLRPTIVGPITSPPNSPRGAATDLLVLNLGGCESLDRDASLGRKYARFIVEGLANSPWKERFQRTVVMSGANCREDLVRRFPQSGMEFLSLSHTDALECLSSARLIVTSPGLTTTLEAFQRGVPTFFLPPQNYSQWCILRSLRSVGLAPASFHWEDVADCPRLADRMQESVRNPIVNEAINRLTADTDAIARFEQSLAQIISPDHDDLAGRQRRFFESLGKCGVKTIARELPAALSQRGASQPLIATVQPA